MGIIIDYSRDDKRTRDLKLVYSDIILMKQLKENDLWWEDSEKNFRKKYNIDSDNEKVDKIYETLKKEFLK